jgi:hypothetical protein
MYMCRQAELPAVLANSIAYKNAGPLKNGTNNITVTFIGFENVSHVGDTPRWVHHLREGVDVSWTCQAWS